MSSEREAAKAAFLTANGLRDARRELMSGDASTRIYERLYLADGTRRIFMDQPPKAETPPCPPEATREERIALGFNAAYRLASGRVDAFVACAGYFHQRQLSFNMRARVGQIGNFVHRDQPLALRDDLVDHVGRAFGNDRDPAGPVIFGNVGHGQAVDIIAA